jgi:formylglycine-generating enzyme required for sulfatase activity
LDETEVTNEHFEARATVVHVAWSDAMAYAT